MKICFKKDMYHTHSRRATRRSQILNSKMGGMVHSYSARPPNNLHDDLLAKGSGDPRISPMYGKPGESTRACASSSYTSYLVPNSCRMASFVDHETKSHLEQHHTRQQAHAISERTESMTCISSTSLSKADCLCSF
jgi:hypothetical protein